MLKNTVALTTALALVAAPLVARAQAPETRPAPAGYQPPTKEEWLAARLDPAEYDLAVRYQVSLEEWKQMDGGRRVHRTAGWACIALGPLIIGLEATIHYGGDVPWNTSPQQELFIMGAALAFASMLAGIVTLAGAPGPEDFKTAAGEKSGSLSLRPAPGGIAVGFSF